MMREGTGNADKAGPCADHHFLRSVYALTNFLNALWHDCWCTFIGSTLRGNQHIRMKIRTMVVTYTQLFETAHSAA